MPQELGLGGSDDGSSKIAAMWVQFVMMVQFYVRFRRMISH